MKNNYRESIWLRRWACVLLLFATAFPSALLLLQSLTPLPAWWHPAPTAALLILIGTFVLITLNFLKLSIKLDSQSIRVSYGMIRKTIPWNEVTSCEITQARFVVYGGVGIRLGTDKSLAFTTSSGNAIRITRKKGLPLVFSTKNPTELSKIINEHLKP